MVVLLVFYLEVYEFKHFLSKAILFYRNLNFIYLLFMFSHLAEYLRLKC